MNVVQRAWSRFVCCLYFLQLLIGMPSRLSRAVVLVKTRSIYKFIFSVCHFLNGLVAKALKTAQHVIGDNLRAKCSRKDVQKWLYGITLLLSFLFHSIEQLNSFFSWNAWLIKLMKLSVTRMSVVPAGTKIYLNIKVYMCKL